MQEAIADRLVVPALASRKAGSWCGGDAVPWSALVDCPFRGALHKVHAGIFAPMRVNWKGGVLEPTANRNRTLELPLTTSASAGDPLKAAPHPSEITDLARRLSFLEISEADRRRLQQMQAPLNASAGAFVESFYRHLFSFEETARFLQDPALVAKLKEAQQAHLASMLEADWTDAYVAQRYRVGDTSLCPTTRATAISASQARRGRKSQRLTQCGRRSGEASRPCWGQNPRWRRGNQRAETETSGKPAPRENANATASI